MDATHVIGQVVERSDRPGDFTICCEGPHGLGINYELSDATPKEALRRAEETLLDLGWRTAGEVFVGERRSQELNYGVA